MNPLFARHIRNTGRMVRALGALALLIGAGCAFIVSVRLGAGLAVTAVFVVFEALHGRCALRACGIKTRI